MLKIYTDGSCSPNPGPGGWAFIGISEKEYHGSGTSIKTTNNIMEMTAVIEALKFFSKYKDFHIVSDSLYVINCATNKWKRNKNTELWKEYDIVSKDKKIHFEWVKGHSGDFYNELVDKLAKKY